MSNAQTPHYLLATPKTCHGCKRTVFAINGFGDCPDCARKGLRGPNIGPVWVDEFAHFAAHDEQKRIL